MKAIKDFFYNISDILITLLILALAGGIIYWRAQAIMGYSELMESQKQEQKIDIDFSDIDLEPEEKEDITSEDSQEPEEPEETIVIDENYVTDKKVVITVQSGTAYTKIIRLVATAYEYDDDTYLDFYQALWQKGLDLGADYGMLAGTFTIPEGTSIEGIFRIISNEDRWKN